MTAVNTRSFYIDQVQDVTVVCFTVTTIVEQNYELVSDELFEIIEYLSANGAFQIVLDLFSVRQIDDWGLAMLRAFHETIETNGGTVVFCRISPGVARTLNEELICDAFPTRKTRMEAIQSFQESQFTSR